MYRGVVAREVAGAPATRGSWRAVIVESQTMGGDAMPTSAGELVSLVTLGFRLVACQGKENRQGEWEKPECGRELGPRKIVLAKRPLATSCCGDAGLPHLCMRRQPTSLKPIRYRHSLNLYRRALRHAHVRALHSLSCKIMVRDSMAACLYRHNHASEIGRDEHGPFLHLVACERGRFPTLHALTPTPDISASLHTEHTHGQSVGSQSGEKLHVSKRSKMRTLTWLYMPGTQRNSPVTRYSSNPSIVSMSPSSITKPPISEFSTIRSFLMLLGSGTKPCCRLQRTKSWPGVHEYFLDRATIFGCFMRNARTSGA